MGWSPDPELRQMFMDELNERSARLLEGARTMRTGPVDAEFAGGMMREGHTIKGTARVLGFEAVSVGGLLVEEIWRRIQHDELQSSEELAVALEALAETVVGAGEADPDTGTVEHYEALTRLSAIVPDIDLPAVIPPDPTVAAPPPEAAADEVYPLPPDTPEVREEAVNPETPVAEPSVPEAAAVEGMSSSAVPPPSGLVTPPGPQSGRAPGGEFARAAMDAVRKLRGEPDTPMEAPAPPVIAAEAAMPAPVPVPPPEPVAAPGDVAPVEATPQPAQPNPAPPGPISQALAELAATPDRPAPRSSDVDFLIESVGRWTDESSMVRAGSLNQLVNGLSETRSQADVLVNLVGRLQGEMSSDVTSHLVEVATSLQGSTAGMLDDSLGLAVVPVTSVTNTLPQLVRLLADKLGKEVAFDVVGDEGISVDRQILERLSEPIRQVIVNAVTHGIETAETRRGSRKPEEGRIEMRVELREGTLQLEISDDGAGIDWEAVRRIGADHGLVEPAGVAEEELQALLFGDGFSTGDENAPESGRGLFLVDETVDALFGRVRIASESGVGTTVTIAVPSARALEKLLLVDAGGGLWALPAVAVEAMRPVADVTVVDGGETRELDWNGVNIPLRSLGAVAGVSPSRRDENVLVVSHRSGRAAFTCGRVRGNYELWVRHLGNSHAAPRHIFGMSILSNGEEVLVLDAGRMVERAVTLPDDNSHQEVRVLVVDDSRGARAVISGALASAGLLPSVAGSVAEALEILDEHEVDALVVDFSMPNADGIALVNEVRARKNQMPIIMLSAVAGEEDQTRAKLAGVDAFFDKGSFQEGVIADTLWQMLDR